MACVPHARHLDLEARLFMTILIFCSIAGAWVTLVKDCFALRGQKSEPLHGHMKYPPAGDTPETGSLFFVFRSGGA